MNNQEAFDTVCKHLFNQGKQAIGGDGGCVYRTKATNLKCAVGCLIPDEEYKVEFEGKGSSSVAHEVPALADVNMLMLCSLQSAHDYSDNWGSTEIMKDKLIIIGEAYGLDTSVLDNLKFEDR